MKRHLRPLLLATLIAVCGAATAEEATPPAAAATVDPLPSIQSRWAEIRYALPEAQQVAAYEALIADIAAARQQRADDVRLLIWEGIALSTQAGAKGGLGALSLAKQAKSDFEAAIGIDPSALGGSAHTSLGSLYYQVPGWPIGFGDDARARAHLKKGLEFDPEGIDANYFYADFLLDQGEYKEAVAHFEKALRAAPRPGRESADAGRRKEAQAGLEKAQRKLS